MSKKLIWLRLSIFCRTEDWDNLLCHISSLKKDIISFNIDSFLCYLNFEDGENIRLALLVKKNKLSIVKNFIDNYFTQFFIKNQLYKDNEIKDVSSLSPGSSMPNIKFNLYNINSFDGQLNFGQGVSEILIEGLKSEKNDFETLITFSFYLYLSAFYSIFNFIPDDYIEKLSYNDINKDFHDLPDPQIIDQIINNESLIIEIAKDVLPSRNKVKSEIDWLKDWENLCLNKIEHEFNNPQISLVHNVHNADKILKDILNGVNEHLGLPKSVFQVILLMTKEVLSQILLNKPVKIKADLILKKAITKEAHRLKVEAVQSTLKKVDHKIIPKGVNEIRLFVIARNESLRLPYFLSYYTDLGVDRIFIINNSSTDNTGSIALTYEKVHLFEINEGYSNHWYWMEYMLENYGKNRWCLVVDVDELFAYPDSENINLKAFVKKLEKNQYTAVSGALLDMHSNKSIRETFCKPGDNPIEYCGYFDPELSKQKYVFYDKKNDVFFDVECFAGGVRDKKLGNSANKKKLICLNKIPLLKFSEETYLAQGMHAINNAKIAHLEGIVFHTKFMSDFTDRVFEEAMREEHFNNASEYKVYKSNLLINQNLNLFSKKSIRYKNTQQLLDLGIMNACKT